MRVLAATTMGVSSVLVVLVLVESRFFLIVFNSRVDIEWERLRILINLVTD